MKFNTAIAAMMGLLNDIDAAGGLTRDQLSVLLRLLCPSPRTCVRSCGKHRAARTSARWHRGLNLTRQRPAMRSSNLRFGSTARCAAR